MKLNLRITGLMHITGFVLLLFALPIGIEGGLFVHFNLDYRGSWHWAIMGGAIMTITLGFIGALLLCVAILISKRNKRLKGKQ